MYPRRISRPLSEEDFRALAAAKIHEQGPAALHKGCQTGVAHCPALAHVPQGALMSGCRCCSCGTDALCYVATPDGWLCERCDYVEHLKETLAWMERFGGRSLDPMPPRRRKEEDESG
jgi:hypothetical protein